MKEWKGILLSHAYNIFLPGSMEGSDSTGLAIPINGVDTAFGSFYGILVHVGAWAALVAFLFGCAMVYFAKKGQQLEEGKKRIATIAFVICAICGLPWFIDVIQRGIASL